MRLQNRMRERFYLGLAVAGMGLGMSGLNPVHGQSQDPADWQTGNPAWPFATVPSNLPSGLSSNLLINPADADLYWVERWDSNDFWANPDVWQNPQDILNHPDVAASGLGFDFLMRYRWIFRDDNYEHALNNGFIAAAFDDLGLPGHVPAGYALREIERELGKPQLIPNGAGTRVWIGTASDAPSGNDNIEMNATGFPGPFVVGEMTIHNYSSGSGRSFRGGDVIAFDSGDPSQPARFILLGADREVDGTSYENWSDDANIRGGTQFRLDSDLEMYLLAEVGAPRFRIRGSSQISGTGDLILNPGNAADYADTGSDNVGNIRRELRVENIGRISTTGAIQINSARIRLTDSSDIINTSGITINEEGQLRLDRLGTVTYDFNHAGGAIITLNSQGHLMDGDSNGAIRQQGNDNVANSINDIATIKNDIVVAGDSRIHARNQSTLILEGDISGPGELRKTGEGFLILSGTNTFGTTWVSNGTLVIDGPDALPVAPLIFSQSTNTRTLNLFGSHTVTLLDGNAPDPQEPGTSNNLTINLGPAGTALTVDQGMIFDNGNEDADGTRFQGDIAGAGDFIKDGDGILRFTRWGKTYTGATIINHGVLKVSESATMTNTSGVTINEGGQLRLSSNGVTQYDFGGVITLDSLGRGGGVTPGQGQGILGGLRQDPGGEDHHATVTTDIVMAGDSGIHVSNATSSLTLTGSISGTGAMVRSGGGELILTGNNAAYTGGTIIDNGVTTVMSGSALGTGAIVFNEPSNNRGINLLNAAQTVAGLSGQVSFGGSAIINLGTGHQFTVEQAGTSTFGGSITGAGTLIMDGPGTLTLSGTNSHTGGTVVSDGTLELSGSLARSNITVDGGTFEGGSGEIAFGLGTSPDLITLLDGILDVSALTVNFFGSASLSEYVLVDYSAGGSFLTASNSLTDDTFFNALNIPTGYSFLNDTTSQQVLLVSGAPALPGDFNLDGNVDDQDIDLLFDVLGTTVPPTDPIFDLTGDNLVDQDDLDELVLNILGTFFGDAILDGQVDDLDLAALQANLGSAAGWASGNFNGDGRVGLRDGFILFENYGSGVAVTAVPEPASVALLGLGALGLLARRRSAR